MRTNRKRRLIAVLIIATCILSVAPTAHGATRNRKGGGTAYLVTALLGADAAENGGQSETIVWGISHPNGVGLSYVVGHYRPPWDGTDGSDTERACLWVVNEVGDVINVHDLSGQLKSAAAVNSDGMVLGENWDQQDGVVPWGGTFSQLPGRGQAINDPRSDGITQIVGSTPSGSVLWEIDSAGTVLKTTPLVDPSGGTLFVQDINNSGLMLGARNAVATLAFLDGDQQLQYLPLEAVPINDPAAWPEQLGESGNAVGNWSISGSERRGILWSAADGAATDFFAVSGISATTANDVQTVDGGAQVVGRAEIDKKGPFGWVWNGSGDLQDLNKIADFSLTAGKLHTAVGINSHGQIIGHGPAGSAHGRHRRYYGFLLTPIP